MEANSLISNTQNQGKDKSRTVINELPDHILQHIISFLPTKLAVQTSVISRRWKSLWRHFTTVDLEETVLLDDAAREQFFNFVETVRKLCNSSNLKKFSLSCDVLVEAAQINGWIRHFINRKVIEELNLEIRRTFQSQTVYFPDSLYQDCGSLKKLQPSMSDHLRIAPRVYFHSLKILSLKNVAFPKHETQQLFSGCPCLEDLSIIDCCWCSNRAVCISSPMLRKLFISDKKKCDYDIDEEEPPDDEDLTLKCQVMIFAGGRFKSFSYIGSLINDYFLNGCSSAIDASIEIECPKWNVDWIGKAGCYVFNLLKELPNVRKLRLSSTAILVLGGTMNLQKHLPCFHKLAELRVVSESPLELSCPALLSIFQNSPCLKDIRFDGGITLFRGDPDKEIKCLMNTLFTCFATHLKVIRICGFKGDKKELYAIRALLKASSVLDTFHIEFDQITMGVKELRLKILNFRRRSRRCRIEFAD